MNIKPLAALALCALAPFAQAHFIFLELDPESPEVVRMRFAEEPLEDTPASLQEKAAPMVVTAAPGEAIPMKTGDGALEGPVAPGVDVVTGSLEYGVLDRAEQGRGTFLLEYHAKGTRSIEAAGDATGLPVEVVASLTEDMLTVTVLHNGAPVADAELDCVLPQELDHVTGVTGADGTAAFPLPQGGWVGIRAMVPVEQSGEHDGTPYALVRHYSTLTFKHGAE